MGNEFKFLFLPLKIGSVVVPNRIVFPAHATMFAEDNLPSERLADYLEERAKGGAGLIISEITSVHPTSFAFGNVLIGFNEASIDGFRRIAERVHRQGAKIFCQLYHCGAEASTTIFSNLPAWAPSPIPGPASRETPHEMEVEEISEVVEGFIRTARNVKEAGYDGVEIHGGHGYLICEFLSSHTNRREDEYGGSLINRMRFLIRIIEGVREACGSEFAIGVRLSGDEMSSGGLTLDDSKEIARYLEETGKVDYLSITVGNHTASYSVMIGDMNVPLGAAVYLAAGIKEVVDLPVITVLRIKDPVQAETILANGQADMIGMCRALIADPLLPQKAKENQLEDIMVCLSCNQECLRRIYKGGRLGCIQNPAAGFEKELGIGTIKTSKSPKNVMIIGGGPGGMEAARVAALRGHKVSLYEKDKTLGGQINLALRVPNRKEIGEVLRYLSRQIEKLKVDVVLETDVTAEVVNRISPEVVIVATGSVPKNPQIASTGTINVLNIWEVLEEGARIGSKVVLVDAGEGSWQSCSVAEYLADRADELEIVSKFMSVGLELNPSSIIGLYKRLLSKNVSLTTVSSLKMNGKDSVIACNLFSGKEKRIENVDTVVVSIGNRARNELYKALKKTVPKVFAIGDCVAPRKITDAMREGNRMARSL